MSNFMEAVSKIHSTICMSREQISLLNKEINKAEEELTKIVSQHFSGLNASWHPEIGEQAMYADFMNNIAFSVQVFEIQNRTVRARGNSNYNTAIYSCTLDLPTTDWHSPCLLLSSEIFAHYRSLFKRVYIRDDS